MEDEEVKKIIDAVREEIKKHDKIDLEKEEKKVTEKDEIISVPCPECGKAITGEPKYCPNCGCELEWIEG